MFQIKPIADLFPVAPPPVAGHRPVATVTLSATLHEAQRLADLMGCEVRVESRGRLV